jgi:hypothetical protein
MWHAMDGCIIDGTLSVCLEQDYVFGSVYKSGRCHLWIGGWTFRLSEEDIYGRSRVHGIWSSRSQKEHHLHLITRRLYSLHASVSVGLGFSLLAM